jgi:hypothetical protein
MCFGRFVEEIHGVWIQYWDFGDTDPEPRFR